MRRAALPTPRSVLTIALVAMLSALAATAYASRGPGRTHLAAATTAAAKKKPLTTKRVEALIAKKLKSVKGAVDTLQSENATLKREVATLQGKASGAAAAAEVSTLKSQVATLQSQEAAAAASPLNSEVSALKGQVATLKSETSELAETNGGLTEEVLSLELTLSHVSYNATGLGGKPTLTISGANLQVVNGQGSTATTNGLGNLIMGYDESAGGQSGSHDVVLGEGQTFSSYGGLIAGKGNTLSGPFGAAFGESNIASALGATVTGGNNNTASGQTSSVSAGGGNVAQGHSAAVTGGNNNTAEGLTSSISGGGANIAKGQSAAVTGGSNNTAEALTSAILGGKHNTIANKAENEAFTILGGFENAGTSSPCATVPATNHC
jgi:predicted  nucleic acid-binding Zn-ribbon protein